MKKFLLAGVALICLSPVAQAADLGSSRSPIPSAVIAPAGFNWTGFYVGGHVGYGWGSNKWGGIPTIGAAVNPLSTVNSNGFFGGGQLGYNWQFGQGVVGVEADAAFAGLDGWAFAPTPNFAFRTRAEMLASLRARGGFAVDRALFYVTGGVALGNYRHSTLTNPGPTTIGRFSNTRTGYTLGAGVEYAFAPNWTAKIEYAYYNFGNATQVHATAAQQLRAAGFGTRISSDIHTVKIGVNYLFATGGAISARY